jgi:hypothetical protein
VYKDALPISKIDQYLDSPIVSWDGKEDSKWVLKWRQANAEIYPLISQVARDYLIIPLAEVDVKRLFSKGHDLQSLRQHSMLLKTMKAVMLSRYKYRRQGARSK